MPLAPTFSAGRYNSLQFPTTLPAVIVGGMYAPFLRKPFRPNGSCGTTRLRGSLALALLHNNRIIARFEG